MKRTVALIVLDGWGIGENNASNPIHTVNPPTFAKMGQEYPMTSLQASGISVGLPWNEVGNSEVGHVTLGAGKVIYQYYPKITMAIQDGTFYKNPALLSAFGHAQKNGTAVNLVGLLTNVNTHASLEHLQALLRMANEQKVHVKLHLFADGKDSAPKSLEQLIGKVPTADVHTLIGRYYAMDRNQNWQLVQKAYDALIRRGVDLCPDWKSVYESTIATQGSEEYMPPTCIGEEGIKDNEALVFFNFRNDSMRELAEAFISPAFTAFPIDKFDNLKIVSMTSYEDSFGIPVAFPADKVEVPLGKVLSDASMTQLRIAETYKYGHVTFFFNGYAEAPFKNEYRVLIPSINTPHPEAHPKLMASQITDRVVEALQNQAFDFILVNYSNPDTIAHTGNMAAAEEAVRVMDAELARLMAVSEKTGTVLLVTSDHGNIEKLSNPMTGEIETQHKKNPVPFYLIAPEFKGKQFLVAGDLHETTSGILSDVAPTILEILGIPKPDEMTGRSLLEDVV